MIGNFNVLRRSQLQNNEGLSPSVEAGVNPSFNSISYKPESWEFAPEERYHSRRIDQDLESYAQNHSAYSRESLEIE